MLLQKLISNHHINMEREFNGVNQIPKMQHQGFLVRVHNFVKGSRQSPHITINYERSVEIVCSTKFYAKLLL
jgi:hypothetical protein